MVAHRLRLPAAARRVACVAGASASLAVAGTVAAQTAEADEVEPVRVSLADPLRPGDDLRTAELPLSEAVAARSRLGFDGGRLGLQLDSGYRMSIRTRSGGVQVALRRNF